MLLFLPCRNLNRCPFVAIQIELCRALAGVSAQGLDLLQAPSLFLSQQLPKPKQLME